MVSLRLVLIDGNAILHRAYHALPPLTNRSGELVNAVYGFSTMLLKVIADLKPDYLAVAFDTEKPTFRQMEYLGYQAQRPKMDEELAGQIEKVHEVLRAFGIPIYEVSGFEADDVIGTLARQAIEGLGARGKRLEKTKNKKPSPLIASRLPLEVIIVTGDRDMMQLVGPKVKIYAPVRSLSEAEIFGQKEVEEKMGIKPKQVVDYKGLVGDPSDNYPGIPGVGPKTASPLLKKYKTFANIYKHLNELPETLVRKLVEGKELAELSQRLARIVTNVPVKLDLKKCGCELAKEERERVVAKFREFGFRSLVERLGQKENRKPATTEIRKRGNREIQKENEQLKII